MFVQPFRVIEREQSKAKDEIVAESEERVDRAVRLDGRHRRVLPLRELFGDETHDGPHADVRLPLAHHGHEARLVATAASDTADPPPTNVGGPNVSSCSGKLSSINGPRASRPRRSRGFATP